MTEQDLEQIVFIDTETTGLDPERHEVWEFAAVWREMGEWRERVMQRAVPLGLADPMALKINKYHDRFDRAEALSDPTFLSNVERITRGKHLAGAVVSFDERRLGDLLIDHNFCPMWHYHLIDVEALAIGYLAGEGSVIPVPWKSDMLTEELELEVPDEDKHTALGDAKWARDIYMRVIEGTPRVGPGGRGY